MALALNFCPDIKFLNRADAGHQYFHFEDRDKSVLSVFWYLIHRLEEGQPSCLVLENQKDAEYLYYLISRYQLSELCIILSGETPEINSNTLSKIKDALGNQQLANSAIHTGYHQYMQQWNAAQKNIKSLQKDVIPGRSAVALIDKINFNQKIQADQIIKTIAPVSSERYAPLKEEIAEVEKIYLNSFSFLEVEFPFYDTVPRQYACSQLTEILDENLDAIEAWLNAYNALESSVYLHCRQAYEQKVRKIKKEIEIIESIDVSDEMSDGNTIKQKRDYHFNKLLQLTGSPVTGIKVYDQEKLDSIKNSIFESDDFHAAGLQEYFDEALSNLHSNKKFRSEADGLLDAADRQIKHIVSSRTIKTVSYGGAVQLSYQKQLLLDFRNRISSALHFLDNNTSYYSWRIFISSLDEQERQIVQWLASNSTDWQLDFDRIYYNQLVERLRLQLDSPTLRLDKLQSDFRPFINALMIRLKRDSISNSGWDTLETLDWENLISHHVSDLARRFPILIIGRKIYVNNKSAIENAYSKTVFFDSLCDQIEDFSDPRNLFTISDRDIQKSISERLAIKSSQWHFVTGPAANINRPLTELNRSELHRASMHLASELDQLHASHRIFQLKNASVISYWSDIKNARLIQSLNKNGIKEIISDTESINLLPAIFSNLEHHIFVLTEDGLFIRKEDAILRQLNLQEAFKNAHIEIVNIDNLEPAAKLDKAIEKIEIATQSQHIEELTK